MLHEVLPAFGNVYGIPRGGTPLARAMKKHMTEGPVLIVDDVFTTGKSMEGAKRGWEDTHGVFDPDPIGAVIFARNPTPPWITALFKMSGRRIL